MADESGGWYVRAKGRTLGPFSRAQLESLRDRGQLAQFHEVSQDKRTWVHALTLSDLFGGRSGSGKVTEDYGPQSALPSAHEAQGWFYKSADGTPGPVSTEQVVALVRSGQVLADAPIWREGFPCWLTLRDVPEFANLLAAAPGPGGGPIQIAGFGVKATAARGYRNRPGRFLVIGAAAVLLIIVGALAMFLLERDRNGEPRPLNNSRDPSINSHMSKDIPRATGLVVSGATVTNLKSGELVEVPGSRGTCFALSHNGFLLTNRHVVEEYMKLTRADAAHRGSADESLVPDRADSMGLLRQGKIRGEGRLHERQSTTLPS